MPRFRKKPVEIEALQFTGENWYTMNHFVGKTFLVEGEYHWGFLPYQGEIDADDREAIVAEVWDKLHDTWVGVKVWQWIIKGVQGEFYPCDAAVFEATYDLVEDHPIDDSEPEEPGFYTYGAGRQTMIFLLRELPRDGYIKSDKRQWYVIMDNGEINECAWGYIEQALGVFDLVKLDDVFPKAVG